MMATPCAEASTTEEPDALIGHVRVCAGGAGQSASLPLSKLRLGEIDGPVRNGLDSRPTIFSLLIDSGDIMAIAHLRE